jgi:site-specific recombinase XerD
MSLRSGMDILSLQRLMGHADIAMTNNYCQMLDADLLNSHSAHGLDSWL